MRQIVADGLGLPTSDATMEDKFDYKQIIKPSKKTFRKASESTADPSTTSADKKRDWKLILTLEWILIIFIL